MVWQAPVRSGKTAPTSPDDVDVVPRQRSQPARFAAKNEKSPLRVSRGRDFLRLASRPKSPADRRRLPSGDGLPEPKIKAARPATGISPGTWPEPSPSVAPSPRAPWPEEQPPGRQKPEPLERPPPPGWHSPRERPCPASERPWPPERREPHQRARPGPAAGQALLLRSIRPIHSQPRPGPLWPPHTTDNACAWNKILQKVDSTNRPRRATRARTGRNAYLPTARAGNRPRKGGRLRPMNKNLSRSRC